MADNVEEIVAQLTPEQIDIIRRLVDRELVVPARFYGSCKKSDARALRKAGLVTRIPGLSQEVLELTEPLGVAAGLAVRFPAWWRASHELAARVPEFPATRMSVSPAGLPHLVGGWLMGNCRDERMPVWSQLLREPEQGEAEEVVARVCWWIGASVDGAAAADTWYPIRDQGRELLADLVVDDFLGLDPPSCFRLSDKIERAVTAPLTSGVDDANLHDLIDGVVAEKFGPPSGLPGEGMLSWASGLGATLEKAMRVDRETPRADAQTMKLLGFVDSGLSIHEI